MNEWILICLIIQGIFDIIAIVLFYLFKVVTDNQEELLFALRDDINQNKAGHIFCKTPDVDGDFKFNSSCLGFKKSKLVKKDGD